MYYPGDCTCDQETCMCDGCMILRGDWKNETKRTAENKISL
jgi:hypothetical protein